VTLGQITKESNLRKNWTNLDIALNFNLIVIVSTGEVSSCKLWC